MKICKLNLERSMAEKGLTITDIRNSTGISSATFSKLKKGESVRPDIVGKVAKALNSSVEELLLEEV